MEGVVVSKLGSKAVSNPIGNAHEVAGVVISTFEDGSDVGDAGNDGFDATRRNPSQVRANRYLLGNQATGDTRVRSQRSDEPDRNAHAVETVANRLVCGDRPHERTVDWTGIHREPVSLRKLMVTVVCFDFEVEAREDGKTEGELKVHALETREGSETDLELGCDDIQASMTVLAVRSDKRRVLELDAAPDLTATRFCCRRELALPRERCRRVEEHRIDFLAEKGDV